MFFHITPQKHMLWYSMSCWALLMSTYNLCFCEEIRKLSILFEENKPFFTTGERCHTICIQIGTTQTLYVSVMYVIYKFQCPGILEHFFDH